MSLPFAYRYRVTYADCTIGNHIYYGRYLELLEAARGEFFRAAGEPLVKWQELGVAFPVIEARVRYHRGARYDEVLVIEVRLVLLKGVRMNFGYAIRTDARTAILEAETFHACTDLQEKPHRLPREILAALGSRVVSSGEN